MLKRIFKISRPRFWVYLFGPFLIGVAAAGQLTDIALLSLYGLYFTLPANLLIYGVNDIFDYDTDKHNSKKRQYETLVKPSYYAHLWRIIVLLNMPVILLAIMSPPPVLIGMIGFLFFGIFYSARPIRAKTKPFLDSFFNILYVFPALVSYGLLSGEFPPLVLVIAGTLWCMAMHAYSAIPDIGADTKAGLRTIATVLRTQGTLVFCFFAYLLAATLSIEWLGAFAIIGGVVYSAMILISQLWAGKIFKIYTVFPYINFMVGITLFFWILLVVK